MIRIEVDEQPIDINQNASFTIGAKSPFTHPGELWGPKVYNVSALDSSRNNRIFQFAKLLNNTNRTKAYPNTRISFGDLLWKIGTFKLRDFSGGYNFSFHTDAGDIEAKVKNRTLVGVELGTAPFDLNTTAIYPEANHVYFTVKNSEFYGDKNPDYSGYVNLYDAANGRLFHPGDGDQYTVSPFPYLLYLLDTIFKEIGYYGITGDWTEDENIRRVVVYNNFDFRDPDTITYNRLVPQVGVGSFLIDVAIFFGITYKVNPVTKYVEIIKIKDWLSDTAYTDLNGKANSGYKLEPNSSDGFRFWMRKDDSDQLFSNTTPSWMDHRIGGGQDTVETQASLLSMISEENPAGANWTIPHVSQEGSGYDFELDLQNRSGLRFAIFDGMKTDSLGNTYPQGHYLRAGFSLRWSGEYGIVNRCYQEWIDWRSSTEYTERTVELSLVELLQLDTQRKIMIDNLKWVIDDYDASISARGKANRIKTNLKLYSVKL